MLESLTQLATPAPAPDERERDALIVFYRKFVHSLVGKMIKVLNLPSESYDEYVAAGYLGLVEAAERFKPESGKDFKRFAGFRIRGAIIDSIRTHSHITGKAYRVAKALEASHNLQEELLSEERGKPQTPAKLASLLDFAAKSALSYRLSYSEIEEQLSEREAPEANPEQSLQRRQDIKKCRELLATLPPKVRIVLEDYYLNGKSFKQIVAERRGMSKSWVSRLHARGLELLKQKWLTAETEE